MSPDALQKISLGFSIRYYGKPWTSLMANAVLNLCSAQQCFTSSLPLECLLMAPVTLVLSGTFSSAWSMFVHGMQMHLRYVFGPFSSPSPLSLASMCRCSSHLSPSSQTWILISRLGVSLKCLRSLKWNFLSLSSTPPDQLLLLSSQILRYFSFAFISFLYPVPQKVP